MSSDPANDNQVNPVVQQNDDSQNSTLSPKSKNSAFFDQLQAELTQLTQQKKQLEEQKLKKFETKPVENKQPEVNSDKNGNTKNAFNELIEKLNSKNKTASTSVNKRKELESQQSAGSPESVPIREVSVDFEPYNEIGEFMEPVPDPQKFTLPVPVEDEFGEILLQSTQITRPNIILPMDDQQIEKALHQKVIESIRWLAEWTKRVILMYPQRVFFKKTIE